MAYLFNGHNTDEFDDAPKVEDTGGLDALFQGVYSSVVEALNVIEQHYLEEVTKDYFDEEGKPKMITLTLPASNGEMKPTMIPAITLVPHNGLSIKEVEIEMEVALSMGAPKPSPKKEAVAKKKTAPKKTVAKNSVTKKAAPVKPKEKKE